MPNVGPYIYEVSISGFTRSSIYIYDISSLRVNTHRECGLRFHLLLHTCAKNNCSSQGIMSNKKADNNPGLCSIKDKLMPHIAYKSHIIPLTANRQECLRTLQYLETNRTSQNAAKLFCQICDLTASLARSINGLQNPVIVHEYECSVLPSTRIIPGKIFLGFLSTQG